MNEIMATENLDEVPFADTSDALLAPDADSDGETSYEETTYISEDDREIVEA